MKLISEFCHYIIEDVMLSQTRTNQKDNRHLNNGHHFSKLLPIQKMHNTVIEDNVIKIKLLKKTGLKTQPYFALGNTRFFELFFFKKNEVAESTELATINGFNLNRFLFPSQWLSETPCYLF